MGLFSFFKRDKIKEGDIIKCIDDREWNDNDQTMKLQYGKLYKVLAIVKCPNCGTTSYDIGCRFNDNKTYTICKLGNNGHTLPYMGVHLAGSFRFEKPIGATAKMSKEELKERLKEAVKNEEYELADEINKVLVAK